MWERGPDWARWVESVPDVIKTDFLWKVSAYRLALFACDISWQDITELRKDQRTRALSSQLYRAMGSVSANIAEGYSRSSAKERARFYEIALGSARESRDWYYKARHVLGDAVVDARLSLLTDIVRLLLSMIPNQRASSVKEDETTYAADEPSPEEE